MSDSVVRRSYRVAIRVRVLMPTNTQGTRLRVWRADASWVDDPKRKTVSWDHGLDGSDNAVAAVAAYLDGLDGDLGWDGEWVIAGASSAEWIAVQVATL